MEVAGHAQCFGRGDMAWRVVDEQGVAGADRELP
jgi:hypothetical protein